MPRWTVALRVASSCLAASGARPPALVDQVEQDARWWYLRYGDPEPHLRLRLSSTPIAEVGAWAQRLRRAGLVARVQLDTNFPETARFGGPAALEAAEACFTTDSAAALTQLACVQRPVGPDLLAVTAASLLNIAVAFIGDTGNALRWLIDRTRPHRPAPARAIYDQAVLLANPDDRAALAALPGGARLLASWHDRCAALGAYRDTLHASGTAPTTLLPDLLHLHHARMIGPDLDSERACLHLARAAALSWTARSGKRP